MAAVFLYPDSGGQLITDTMRAALADSVLKLFQNDLTVNVNTTLAQLDAQEADFSGYTSQAIATFDPPYRNPNGGWTTSAGYFQWNWTPATPPDPDVENQIYGFYVVSDGGDLVCVGKFAQPVPMQVVGNSLPLTLNLTFGRN